MQNLCGEQKGIAVNTKRNHVHCYTRQQIRLQDVHWGSAWPIMWTSFVNFSEHFLYPRNNTYHARIMLLRLRNDTYSDYLKCAKK